ncbi:MAG: hypothetical protein Q3979_06050 [Actinomycetaceae bacterium]|nr:hypothetical protein [Actinomycetaceae bacterium]
MNSLAGTRLLLAASLRHDGRLLAPWVAIVAVLSSSSILAYAWIFPTSLERTTLASTVEANPAMGLIFGPAWDLSTSEGFNTWRALAIGGFLAAMCAILAVVRATRAQEDSGQAELLASGVLGRSARLMTGVVMATVGSLAIGVVSFVVTIACRASWHDTALLCATFVVMGVMFACLAAVAVQLGANGQSASTLAVATLGALFAARGFAYSMELPEWTIWINPLGWMTMTKPAHANAWWPLLPGLALAAIALVVAFALQSRRDYGEGLVTPNPGPAHGSLAGPFALTLRLSRTTIVTWTLTALILGSVFGYFTTSVGDMFANNAMFQQILAAGATTSDTLMAAFLRSILCLVGILCAVPGISIMLRIRSEELADRLEPLLATSLSRVRYYAANLTVAFTTSALLMVIAGVTVGAVSAAAGEPTSVADATLQAVATVPAVWLVVAVSVAVVGARPRVAMAAWAGVLLSFAITLFGPTFRFPNWALAISPFYHVPNVTLATASLAGLGVVALIAAALTAAGLIGFRRRDVATS